MNEYNVLIQKLDQFVRKYYLNKVIKGSLILTGFVTIYFVSIALLENYFYFNTSIRKVLFYSFCLASCFTLVKWVIAPLVKYFRLGDTMTNEQASVVIGQHFPEVSDKLLNVLQLHHQSQQQNDNTLLLAGIDQKTKELTPISFKSAIDLSKNKKYLKYALPPLLLLIGFLFAGMITKPADRLINNNKIYKREAPFSFILKDNTPEVPEMESYTLELQLRGKAIPKEVEVIVHNTPFKLYADENGRFSYQFNNVQDNTPFYFEAAGFTSDPYELKVVKKAALNEIKIALDYPNYTGRKDEIVGGSGDLNVPFGTKINYIISTRATQSVKFQYGQGAIVDARQAEENQFSFIKTALLSEDYKVFLGNQSLPYSDSLNYSLQVILDASPTISLEKYVDSSNQKLVYLSGNVTDDYGISKIILVQHIKSANGSVKKKETKVSNPKDKQGFYSYLLDISKSQLNPGDELNYYFEVFDNDVVRGPKSARTQTFSYKKLSVKETEKKIEEVSKEIQSDLEKNIKESRRISNEINKLKEKLLQQKSLNWEDKEQLESLMQKQEELQKRIDEMQKKIEEKRKDEEEVKNIDPELKEKQDKLDEMIQEMKNPEEQKMLEKIQELMNKLDKKESMKQLDQMKLQNADYNKNMDRILELLKQLELEMKVKETSEKLEKLAEKQDKLADKTNQNQQDQEQLKKDQKEVKEEFEDIKKKMDEIQKENKELKTPNKLDDQQESKEDIDQDMEKSEESLEKKQNSAASKSQKSASKKMKQMAQNMKNDMEASQAEQIELDMAAVRQILENVLTLSFDQERLIKQNNQFSINTPMYLELMRQQMKVKSDFKMVDDSLSELSKRVMEIESFITKKVGDVNLNLNASLDKLEERENVIAAQTQQQTMTGLNDLALMLSDVLQNMQMKMSQSKPGSGSCDKPGGTGSNPKPGGKSTMPQMDKLTQGQQKLSKSMKDQKGKMDKGEKPGSADFGQMATEQAKLRKALQDYDAASRALGQGKKPISDLIDAMEKIEKDLVNKRLTNEMINRQEEITIRLLEEERAQREQEQEEQRKAEKNTTTKTSIPPSMLEYIKKREAGIDEIKPIYPALTPYYHNLVQQYYNHLRK